MVLLINYIQKHTIFSLLYLQVTGNPRYILSTIYSIYIILLLAHCDLKFFNTTLCRIFLSSCNSLYETDVVHQQDVRVRLPK